MILEEELFSYAMIIESIEDYEKNNPIVSPNLYIIDLKKEIKNRLIVLPNQISNDLSSQSL